jgi:hypothetical protein
LLLKLIAKLAEALNVKIKVRNMRFFN